MCAQGPRPKSIEILLWRAFYNSPVVLHLYVIVMQYVPQVVAGTGVQTEICRLIQLEKCEEKHVHISKLEGYMKPRNIPTKAKTIQIPK